MVVIVRKSYGKMRGTRQKLAGKNTSITRALETFKDGEIVHVDLSTQKFPHPRFQGKTGKILEARGNAYVVEVKDGNKLKKVCLKPDNLRKAL